MDTEKIYDMLIIGGGPAGYTAALYAARAGLSVLVLERLAAGGQMALTHRIENYPGFDDGVEGFELGAAMCRQAQKYGAQSKNAQVNALQLHGIWKQAETDAGLFRGKTLVLATGAGPRELGLPGEQELVGQGLHYCAACDGMFYRNKTVAVIGGGNTAVSDALLLSRIAKKVILIHRRASLRGEKVIQDALFRAKNVEFRWNSTVTELLAEDRLTGIRIRSEKTGMEEALPCDGVFISIGRNPASALVQDQLEVDDNGYLIAGETTETSIPGVYAVGDVRKKSLHQIVTAVADGAVAAHQAQEYLAGNPS